MVYEPGNLRKLGFSEALYVALFPKTYPSLIYTFYQPNERGTLGRVFNRLLKILLELIGTLNTLLTPLSMLLMLVLMPLVILSLPYHAYHWLFHRNDVSLKIPLYIHIVSFPSQMVIWILFLPVKALQVKCVLLASILGPKDIRQKG